MKTLFVVILALLIGLGFFVASAFSQGDTMGGYSDMGALTRNQPFTPSQNDLSNPSPSMSGYGSQAYGGQSYPFPNQQEPPLWSSNPSDYILDTPLAPVSPGGTGGACVGGPGSLGNDSGYGLAYGQGPC